MVYTFVYDLEGNQEVEDIAKYRKGVFYGIRYYVSEKGIMVEIGDGYRHEIFLEGKYWNRILNIIKHGELDKEGIMAITMGLMGYALPEEYLSNFLSAIKEGKIKKIVRLK